MICDSFCPITFSTAPTCFVCSFHGRCKKETAPGATNTGSGKAGNGFKAQKPASNISESLGGFKNE